MDHTFTCSIRFFCDSQDTIDGLKNNFDSFNFVVRENQSKTIGGTFVVSLRLNDEIDYDSFCSYIKKNISKFVEYGFFISLATEYDSYIVRIPDFVLKLHQKLGGTVDFSFTSLSLEQ